MKVLLDFLIGKLDIALKENNLEKARQYKEMCDDCFSDRYVVGNEMYHDLREEYKRLLKTKHL